MIQVICVQLSQASWPRSRPASSSSQMKPVTSAAAAGEGRPWNQRLSTVPVFTLKRASRSAAQAQ